MTWRAASDSRGPSIRNTRARKTKSFRSFFDPLIPVCIPPPSEIRKRENPKNMSMRKPPISSGLLLASVRRGVLPGLPDDSENPGGAKHRSSAAPLELLNVSYDRPASSGGHQMNNSQHTRRTPPKTVDFKAVARRSTARPRRDDGLDCGLSSLGRFWSGHRSTGRIRVIQENGTTQFPNKSLRTFGRSVSVSQRGIVKGHPGWGRISEAGRQIITPIRDSGWQVSFYGGGGERSEPRRGPKLKPGNHYRTYQHGRSSDTGPAEQTRGGGGGGPRSPRRASGDVHLTWWEKRGPPGSCGEAQGDPGDGVSAA